VRHAEQARHRDAVRFHEARGEINAVRVSPDGHLVAAAASDGHLHVWTADGTPWLRLPHHGILHCVDFSPDGTRLAAACSDGTVRIWPMTDDAIDALARECGAT
jgi:WD40 repeat protein